MSDTTNMIEKLNIGILGLNPGEWVKDDLEQLSASYNLFILDEPTNTTELSKLKNFCKENNILSCTSFEQDSILAQSILNRESGYKSFSSRACIYAMNKYLSRTLAEDSLWFSSVTLSESNPQILKKIDSFPCMLKSTLHNLGSFIFKVNSKKHLFKVLDELKKSKRKSFEDSRDLYLSFCANEQPTEKFPYLIVEKYIELKSNYRQFSVDCFSDNEGRFHPFVIREELYFPNLQKRGYLFPPEDFGEDLCNSLEQFLNKFALKFKMLGHFNQFFNIECWLDGEGTFQLCEINPIPNLNFLDMYKLMDGESLLQVILDLHHKRRIPKDTPYLKMKRGQYNKHFMQSEINTIETGKAKEIVDYTQLAKLESELPVKVLLLIGDHNFEFTSVHMSSPGWPIAEVYSSADNLNQLLALDLKIRQHVYKDSKDHKA